MGIKSRLATWLASEFATLSSLSAMSGLSLQGGGGSRA